MGMDFPMNLPDLAESQRKAAVDGTIAAPVTNNNDTNNGTGKCLNLSMHQSQRNIGIRCNN